MNNEIKEILDNMFHIIMKYEEDFEDLEENEIRYQLPYKKMQKLYDYITNLQQENEFLKLSNPEMNIEHFRVINENKRKIDNLRKQNKELQQENERLKVKYDNDKSHEINYKYFTTLYSKTTKDIVIDDLVYKCEDLDNLKQSYEKLYVELEDYKTRCEKAIELINVRYKEQKQYDKRLKDLLNILQNGDDSQ